MKKTAPIPRWFAGLHVAADCRRIEAATIGIHGQGTGAAIEIRKALSFDLPSEITAHYGELQSITSRQHSYEQNDEFGHRFYSDTVFPISLYHHVKQELAAVEEEALDELLIESQLSRKEIFVAGINDSGIRTMTPNGLYFSSLCDAAHLAERTELNIIDAFPLNDIASCGQGGPILALPNWIFLKSTDWDRLLVDLGKTARIQFLPQAVNGLSHQQILCRDIIPCGSFLDALTIELTQGESTFDVGGKLTVQGCQIPELLSELHLLTPKPSVWNPFGLDPSTLLKTAIRMTTAGHSVQDILCTVTVYIAKVVAQQISELLMSRITPNVEMPEVLLTGSARRHGMLMNLISSHLRNNPALSDIPLLPVTQLGIPAEMFDAISVAMLSAMNVDQIPSNLPHLTGSEIAKPLGRITPGSAANWYRLIQEMAQTKPGIRAVKCAG